MVAIEPAATGVVQRDGVRVAWQGYGTGDPAILFLPTWSIAPARAWKAQVPFFSRRHRVVTFDPRGNGASDRPSDPALYDEQAFADDAAAVLDAAGIGAAIVVSLSMGAQRALLLSQAAPERVLGLVFLAPTISLSDPDPDRVDDFEDVLDSDEGWAKYNAHYWRRDLPGFARFFFGRCLPEPHSTKQIEDHEDWSRGTTGEILIATHRAGRLRGAEARAACAQVHCPTLVIQGTDDEINGVTLGLELASALGAQLACLERAGHLPPARHPVRTNLLIRDFVRGLAGSRA